MGTLIAALLIGLAMFAVSQQKKPTKADDGTVDTANYTLANQPFVGKEDAPITMMVVEDFKCPICATFEDGAFAEIKSKYIDTGKVKAYSIFWPFIAELHNSDKTIDDSKIAAQAAICAFEQGQAQFEQFKPIVFRAQGAENLAWATKDRMKELAANVEGLDQDKFAQCLDTDATKQQVEATKKEIVDSKAVNGTPTVFINGKKVDATVDAISAAIDAVK